MPEPTRRWRFQIHLSTAIVLMFVAGGLIWANVIPANGGNIYVVPGKSWSFESSAVNFPFEIPTSISTRGWPWRAYVVGREDGHLYWYSANAPIYDLALATLILFAVWFLCEWLIRRRAARKGA